jgi:medium-chain acyl-[acyl-carrier-protein] hydrolase
MWLYRNRDAGNNGNPWLAYLKPKPEARLHLFCFSYAGGSASLFRGWQDNLPDWVQVYPVQLPGREGRFKEAPFTHLPDLIEAMYHSLNPFLQRKPFVFFGYSLGTLVCFELARKLRREGDNLPLQLLLAAHAAPPLTETGPRFLHLSDEDFLHRLDAQFGTLPKNLRYNREFISLIMPMLRADFALEENYRYYPEEPLPCPITVYRGAQDASVSVAELAGWRQETGGEFELVAFPGDHFFVQNSLKALLTDVESRLNRTVS